MKKRRAPVVEEAPQHLRVPPPAKKVAARDNWQKFLELRQHFSHAMLVVKQMDPYMNEGIPPVPVSMFANFSEFVAWLQRHHWTGEQASFFYTAYDESDVITEGQIQIAADARKAAREEPAAQPFGYSPAQPGYFPPPGGLSYLPNPFPPQPPNYGPPPGYPTQYAPASPPQHSPAPMPERPSMQIQIPEGAANSEVFKHLVALVERTTVQYSQLYEQHRSLLDKFSQLQAQQTQQTQAPQHGYPPGYGAQPPMQPPGYPTNGGVPGAYPPGYGTVSPAMAAPGIVGQPPPAPSKPKSQLEEMRETMGQVRELASMLRQISDENAPEKDDKPEEDPKKDEDPFPFKVKELPHMRFVTTEKGDPVDMTTMLMMNGDKIQGFAKDVGEKVRELFKETAEQRAKEREAMISMLREAAEIKSRAMSMGSARPETIGVVPPAHQAPVQQPFAPRPFPQPNQNTTIHSPNVAPVEPVVSPAPSTPAPSARGFGSGRRVVDLSLPRFLKPVPEPIDDEPIVVSPPIPEPEVVESGDKVADTAG